MQMAHECSSWPLNLASHCCTAIEVADDVERAQECFHRCKCAPVVETGKTERGGCTLPDLDIRSWVEVGKQVSSLVGARNTSRGENWQRKPRLHQNSAIPPKQRVSRGTPSPSCWLDLRNSPFQLTTGSLACISGSSGRDGQDRQGWFKASSNEMRLFCIVCLLSGWQ